MSSNVRSFNLRLSQYAEREIPEKVGKLHRALALEGLRGVVLMSPVDTGRFRGNWQVTQGEPAAGALEATDKAGGPTIAKGSAVIAQAKPFSATWIVNNLPYAQRLEDGWSKQAPGGMVKVTAARLESLADRIRP